MELQSFYLLNQKVDIKIDDHIFQGYIRVITFTNEK
jgi:hypothetical protein